MGYKVKKIYVGTNLVRPVWKPNVNTLAYYPLESNANDYSGNNRNLTNSGITFTNNVGVFNGSAIGYYKNQTIFNSLSAFTYSVWVNPSQITSGTSSSGDINTNIIMSITENAGFNAYDKTLSLCNSSQAAGYQYYNGQNYTYATGISINTWYLLTYTFDGSIMKLYKNGTLIQSKSCGGSYTGYSQASLVVGNNITKGPVQPFYGKLSKVIVENRAWDLAEIKSYYNHTKSNYGL